MGRISCSILLLSSQELQQAVGRIIQLLTDHQPQVTEHADGAVTQINFSLGITDKLVLATTDERMMEALGPHTSAIGIEVVAIEETAAQVVDVLRQLQMSCSVVKNPFPDVPAGFLIWINIKNEVGIMLSQAPPLGLPAQE